MTRANPSDAYPTVAYGSPPSAAELRYSNPAQVEFAEREHLPPVLHGVASMSKDERAGVPNGRPNQDSTYPPARHGSSHGGVAPDVFVVADGVGGSGGGEIASQVAANAFPVAVERFRDNYPPIIVLKGAVNSADEAIRNRKAEGEGSCPSDAATTFTAAVRVDADTWGIAAAGDSPAFVVRADGWVEQIVEEQVNPDIPSQITSWLDGEPPTQNKKEPQFKLVQLRPGDKLVMVTDGVVGDWTNQRIAPETIAEIVRQYPSDPKGAADALLSLPRELQERGYRYPGYGQPFMAPGEFGDLVEWPANTPFEGKLGDDASAIVIERPIEENTDPDTANSAALGSAATTQNTYPDQDAYPHREDVGSREEALRSVFDDPYLSRVNTDQIIHTILERGRYDIIPDLIYNVTGDHYVPAERIALRIATDVYRFDRGESPELAFTEKLHGLCINEASLMLDDRLLGPEIAALREFFAYLQSGDHPSQVQLRLDDAYDMLRERRQDTESES